jgi:hypothetical protein
MEILISILLYSVTCGTNPQQQKTQEELIKQKVKNKITKCHKE